MTNFDLSEHVFDFLKASDVREVVICAGARNAPLIMALQKQKFKIYSFFEERSAAFFALGLVRASNKPVAILTTSGTAAAELLPAAIEATYQGLPLILITADRPKNYRGSGAPQTIDQIGLFSKYVESSYDLNIDSKTFKFNWSFTQPIHLNICFDEPLIDEATPDKIKPSVAMTRVIRASAKPIGSIECTKPLLIIGSLAVSELQPVIDFILKNKAPVLAESTSQLRCIKQIEPYLLNCADSLINQLFREKKLLSVVRIGGIPTLRFWRDLEAEFATLSVKNFTSLKFSGLARGSETFDFALLSQLKAVDAHLELDKIKNADNQLQLKKLELLKEYPLSEPAFVENLSQHIGDLPIYLGNSLPIRHWDQFTLAKNRAVYANRGANGIDGQISTYLGWSELLPDSYCLVGDLTALYDLAALGLTNQMTKNKRKIVIINNFGGQIFNRVFKNDLFINAHQIQFKHWAAMWNWPYYLINSEAQFAKLGNESAIIELQPNADQTKIFWSKWDEVCRQKI